MKIVLTGRIPSKKNSKQIVGRGKKKFLITSEAHKKWHSTAVAQVLQHKLGKPNLDNVSIEIKIYFPDKRVADLTNKAESIMDLIVDCDIIKDDNWKVVSCLMLNGDYDKENPRAEISIIDLNEISIQGGAE